MGRCFRSESTRFSVKRRTVGLTLTCMTMALIIPLLALAAQESPRSLDPPPAINLYAAATAERWADGRIERLQSLAQDLASKKPAVIVAAPSQSVAAVAKAAMPIVHATGSDPVAAGFVKSLERHGGMITGLTNVVTDV